MGFTACALKVFSLEAAHDPGATALDGSFLNELVIREIVSRVVLEPEVSDSHYSVRIGEAEMVLLAKVVKT
jgi:hypothetical protein